MRTGDERSTTKPPTGLYAILLAILIYKKKTKVDQREEQIPGNEVGYKYIQVNLPIVFTNIFRIVKISKLGFLRLLT